VVVDPADAKLRAHFLVQLGRKYAQIKNFEGLVVDRSDWNSLFNYDFDDGASFVNNRTAHLAQYSYVETLDALRAMMKEKQGATRAKQTVMLQNALGFCQLSLFKAFDGTFSEGAIVNAVGILGARSTSILWTSNARECCSSEAAADVYFQRRLYMKVYPMAPFPQADHCIGSDAAAEVLYIRYGGMMSAMRGAKYLLMTHAVNVSGSGSGSGSGGGGGGSGSASLVANAFEMPSKTGVYSGVATLWPLMLGGNATSATLQVAYLPPVITFHY